MLGVRVGSYSIYSDPILVMILFKLVKNEDYKEKLVVLNNS